MSSNAFLNIEYQLSKDDLNPLAEVFFNEVKDIIRLYIFGSTAKGTIHSDIDILVLTSGSTSLGWEVTTKIKNQLKSMGLGTEYDILTYDQKSFDHEYGSLNFNLELDKSYVYEKKPD